MLPKRSKWSSTTGQRARIHRMNWRHQNIRLRRLEAEAIYIMREVVSEFRNPVMLYSMGKDSSALLHIAQKAFHPGKPPFPLLHVCLLYTSDAADDLLCVDLGGRRIIKK